MLCGVDFFTEEIKILHIHVYKTAPQNEPDLPHSKSTAGICIIISKIGSTIQKVLDIV